MSKKGGATKRGRDAEEAKEASPSKRAPVGKSPSAKVGGVAGGALPDYVSLTSHAGRSGVKPVPLNWEGKTAAERGPIVATNRDGGVRNAIGAHGGSYCIYRALAVAAGALDPDYMPDFRNTTPAVKIGPFPAWSDATKIATFDPYGHTAVEDFGEYLEKGYDVRPTIAVTHAHCEVPEIGYAVKNGRLKPDGKILLPTGQTRVLKMAVEPSWYLPEIARRFGCDEGTLRRNLFHQTNGMYPELMTRNDLKVFLPPIGGLTIYIFGDYRTIPDESIPLTVRVHDECNGSDVFGSDICTCRPYLIHGIEEAVKTAQEGGCGIIVYFRKEGRALGEVTKYLVYNLRKRQEGGDTAEKYFDCTKGVAGVEDMRFQALMPDALHWLGVTRIHKLISMSDMKYNAITSSGIVVEKRVPIPPELVPEDAKVEINAKVVLGYHGGDTYKLTKDDLKTTVGRKSDAFFDGEDGAAKGGAGGGAGASS